MGVYLGVLADTVIADDIAPWGCMAIRPYAVQQNVILSPRRRISRPALHRARFVGDAIADVGRS